MKTDRPKAALTVTTDKVAQLQSLITARAISHGLGTRARMILLSHEGLSNAALAQKLAVTSAAVRGGSGSSAIAWPASMMSSAPDGRARAPTRRLPL